MLVCDRKAESSLRVVRTQLDNGQRVIGVRYPQLLISLAEKAAAAAADTETWLHQRAVSICHCFVVVAAVAIVHNIIGNP